MTKPFLLLPTLAAALLISACGNDDGGPVVDAGPMCIEAKFSEVHKLISGPRCATAGCHGGDTPAGGLKLDVDVATAHANLVGAATANSEAAGSFPTRVVARSSTTSFFYLKVAEAMPPGGGSGRMPPGGMLTACDVEAIAQWINEGAENN